MPPAVDWRGDMKTATTFATAHTVTTVCPLDCPDSCSLDVTVQDRRITAIDGSEANPVTGGYICAKVRRFPERLYGPDRLLHPAVRKGPKGAASFARVSWDEALELIAGRMLEARERWGGEAILPYSSGGIQRPAHPGHERRDPVPPAGRLAARAHRLCGTNRRRQPDALRQDAVGQLRGFPRGAADRAVGRQSLGLGHPSRAVPSRRHAAAARA